MGLPQLEYDEEADVLYVTLAEGDVAETRDLDDLRMVDYASDGTVLGVEFIGARGQVLLEGVPAASTVARAIEESGLALPVHA